MEDLQTQWPDLVHLRTSETQILSFLIFGENSAERHCHDATWQFFNRIIKNVKEKIYKFNTNSIKMAVPCNCSIWHQLKRHLEFVRVSTIRMVSHGLLCRAAEELLAKKYGADYANNVRSSGERDLIVENKKISFQLF